MHTFREKFANNVYSQNGEDGIIEEILRRIERLSWIRVAVEFGAADGYWCSNTRALEKRKDPWTLFQFDINASDSPVTRMKITPENVNLLPECSLISMDTDGQDYAIWNAYEGEPAVVIIEIDSSLEPTQNRFNNDGGANYSVMVQLGLSKGYMLICHTGNLIFVHRAFVNSFPELDNLDPIKNWEEFFNKSWLNQ